VASEPPLNSALEGKMQIERYLEQVKAIAASQLVDQYLVGITANEHARRLAYAREGFEYFFILETRLSREEALALEQALFCTLAADPELRAKYHHKKRDEPYRASTGGAIGEAYCLYIAAFAH
jgi:hypothetical protein